jgi:DNA-binding response OmpR family regulator
MMKALIVDDDRILADVVAFALRREGFEVIQAYDGASAIRRWSEEQPDIIVLDVNMPNMDGFTVCRHIREQSDTPIILLTVRGEEDDIVQGLDIGADDYIVKPFSPRQLVARTKAVLRRAGQVSASPQFQIGDLRFDPSQREVIIGERDSISLTPLESRLLDCLMVNVGHVLTTDVIIDHVWGPSGGDRDMLRQLVRRLRGKIEPNPSNPSYIKTVPGLGYGLVGKPEIG